MSNELLYAMSMSTTLNTNRLNELINKVYVPTAAQVRSPFWSGNNLRRQLLDLYIAQGFLDIDFDKRKAYMCHPTLIQLPTHGIPRALLSGARVPYTVRSLKEAVKKAGGKARLIQQSQRVGWISMPDRILVEAVNKTTISNLAKDIGVYSELSEPASWKIAKVSESILDIRSKLIFEPRQEPNWRRRVFFIEKVVFRSIGVPEKNSMFLAEYMNPTNKQLRHYLWCKDSAASVDRNWGRYIILAEKECDVLMYCTKSRKLGVPITAPLPTLLARASTLTSGITPTLVRTNTEIGSIPNKHNVLIYHHIPAEVVRVITSRLGQKPHNVDIGKVTQKYE